MSRSKKQSFFAATHSIDDLSSRSDVDDSLFSFETKRGSQTGSRVRNTRVHARSFFILIIGFLICLAQLGNLQILHGKEYFLLATNNRVRETIIPAARGEITDRQGVLLAYNTPSFQLFLNSLYFEQSETRKTEVKSMVTQVTGLPFATDFVEDKQLDSYSISKNINHNTAMTLLAWNDRYPEYTVEAINKRSYITDRVPSLSHVLGYIGNISEEQYAAYRSKSYRLIDFIGQNGLERFYEEKLRGTPGKKQIEVNAKNEVQRIASIANPIPGEEVKLTLDVSLQSQIESVLKKRLPAVGHNRASVVIMDPKTGAVLALVSWPAYDANIFINQTPGGYKALLDDPDRPLFHRAISGAYPAGSTIKPLYAAAALIEGVITPTTSFLSNGGIQVGPWFFPDWKAGGHGQTNVYRAIAESVNTFFYFVGGGYDTFEGLGIDRLMQYARLFGLAEKTGIDQSGEEEGFLPSPEWKLEEKGERWYVGDTYNVSIGQGDVLVTPLQMARVASVFANGGNLVTPHLLTDTQIISTRIIPEETAKIIQDAMRQTVLVGTAKTLQPLPVTSAGKTGTAQWSNGKANHSWFIGYAPYENPEVAFAVLVEEDKTGYAAVPIIYDVLRFWFDENNDRGTL